MHHVCSCTLMHVNSSNSTQPLLMRARPPPHTHCVHTVLQAGWVSQAVEVFRRAARGGRPSPSQHAYTLIISRLVKLRASRGLPAKQAAYDLWRELFDVHKAALDSASVRAGERAGRWGVGASVCRGGGSGVVCLCPPVHATSVGRVCCIARAYRHLQTHACPPPSPPRCERVPGPGPPGRGAAADEVGS